MRVPCGTVRYEVCVCITVRVFWRNQRARNCAKKTLNWTREVLLNMTSLRTRKERRGGGENGEREIEYSEKIEKAKRGGKEEI